MRRTFVLVLFTLVGFVAGLVLTARMRTAGESAAQARESAESPSAQRGGVPTGGPLPDLTGIAQRAIDGVTNISSTQTVRR